MNLRSVVNYSSVTYFVFDIRSVKRTISWPCPMNLYNSWAAALLVFQVRVIVNSSHWPENVCCCLFLRLLKVPASGTVHLRARSAQFYVSPHRIGVAKETCHLPYNKINTEPVTPSTDSHPVNPNIWQGSHWNDYFCHWYKPSFGPSASLRLQNMQVVSWN